MCCTYTSSNSVAILPIPCWVAVYWITTTTKLSFTDTNSVLVELEPRRVNVGEQLNRYTNRASTSHLLAGANSAVVEGIHWPCLAHLACRRGNHYCMVHAWMVTSSRRCIASGWSWDNVDMIIGNVSQFFDSK